MLNVLFKTIKTEIRNARFCFPSGSIRGRAYLAPMLEVLDALTEVLEPNITALAAELLETILYDQANHAEWAECSNLAAHLHCARGATMALCVYLEERGGYAD